MLDLPHVPGRLEEWAWIDGLPVYPDLEVKMVTGRAASRAHACDLLALRHLPAHAGAEARQMSVTCHDAVAVRNLDHIAIAATLPDEGDLARCSGEYPAALGWLAGLWLLTYKYG